MSDDLVKRLRKLDDDSFVETMHSTAADRIEELEVKLEKAVAELERLGFDFQCTVGRELTGQK